jgi:hypothetical protein
MAGPHGTESVGNYLNTGKMNYQPPPAAQVAERIKNFGETPQVAMQKVGYKGDLQQLFNDFKNIMGVK